MNTPDHPTQLGTWLSLASPVIAELAAESGFDWLLFDLEHGCGTEAALLPQLQSTRGTPVRRIVRVGAPHPDLILHVLDWGADGLMVPHVNNAADAEHVVQAAHYPPRGHRGFARNVRACGYGLRPLSVDGPLPEPFILAQIETIEAVGNARAIAAVHGISALFVGPADLSLDLKARRSERTYDDCLREVVSAATDAGKPCGILLRQAADLPQYQALGFTWIAIDSDLGLVREGFRKLRDSVPCVL